MAPSLLVVSLLALAACGCGKEKEVSSGGGDPAAAPTPDEPPQPDVPDVPAPEVEAFEGIELQLDAPLKVPTCFARLIPGGDSVVPGGGSVVPGGGSVVPGGGSVVPGGERRPTIVEWTSYSDVESEVHPSVLLHAEVDTDNISTLSGKQFKARLYVQQEPEGPVWHPAGDQWVDVRITSASSAGITAEVTGGELVNTQTRHAVQVRGKLHGKTP